MADIKAVGASSTVTLDLPDADGDYGWSCTCGASSESVQPIADAIEDADAHVDIRCPLIEESE
jgi:hypothetical protein